MNGTSGSPSPRGGAGRRGTRVNPPNRFQRYHSEPLEIDVPRGETDDPGEGTQFFTDASRSVLARNDSPDVPFTFSLNPYRGCEHGCIYCYARPSHEYLGFSSGLDFETKIMVKTDAPELLAREFRKASWKPQTVALCGNTDCYQPVERRLGITRRCLGVFLEFRNPVGVITKNALILRDLDLLGELARLRLAAVTISITTLDRHLASRLEPRTAAPAKRLEAIERLTAAGVPVSVLVAPVIPGLTDHEIPSILGEAASRGAVSAGMTLLRLPGRVDLLFTEWLRREYPDAASKVLGRVRETRGGKLHEAAWGKRMTGEGTIAGAIHRLFRITSGRLGLDGATRDPDCSLFRRGGPGQERLFD